MARFTVRVELHGVRHESEKYEQLHEAMAEEGFSREVFDSRNTVTYQLPTAEYNFVGTGTKHQVLGKAKRGHQKLRATAQFL